jgi:hypothetical protein
MFLWRFLFLCGVFCATGYQQKQTWFLEAFYHQKLITPCLDAERLNGPHIYSSLAVLLVLCGLWFVPGLVFLWWTLILFKITLSSLPIQWVVYVRANFFLQLIWLACAWVVWSERNHRLFRGSRIP